MKKKSIFTFLVFLLPLISFADEANSSEQETQTKEIEEMQNNENDSDEIALNLPLEDELKKDFNIDTSQIESTSQTSDLQDHLTFPMETTLGFNLDNYDAKYFLQAKGSDVLNSDKNQKVDFLVKVPYLQQTTSANSLGVTPDEFTFHYLDPAIKVTIGDEKYNLSDLTMSKYQARGGSFKIGKEDLVGLTALYLTSKPTKDKNPSDNLGASIFIKPIDQVKVSSNFLLTRYTEKLPIDIEKNNFTYSVKSIFHPHELVKLELEGATTNNFDKKSQAYFVNLSGKNEILSYSNNWTLANPHFVGKASDQAKLENNVKFEKDNLVVKANHKFEKTNLDFYFPKEKAKRERISQVSFSYPIIKHVISTISLQKRASKNLLASNGYKLDAIALKTSIPLKIYTFENILEYGKHKCRQENYKVRNWQNIQLFLNNKYSENNLLSVYTKLGNLLYEDVYTLSYAAGTSFKMQPHKNCNLFMAYEYSINRRKLDIFNKDVKMKWNNHYFKQDLTYILPNEHKITLTSHLNKPLSYKKEKVVLLTYTIPLNVPHINRTIDTIKNRFF